MHVILGFCIFRITLNLNFGGGMWGAHGFVVWHSRVITAVDKTPMFNRYPKCPPGLGPG